MVESYEEICEMRMQENVYYVMLNEKIQGPTYIENELNDIRINMHVGKKKTRRK